MAADTLVAATLAAADTPAAAADTPAHHLLPAERTLYTRRMIRTDANGREQEELLGHVSVVYRAGLALVRTEK